MRNLLATMILLLVAISAFSQGMGPCQNGQPGLEPYCAPPPPANGMVMPKQTLPPIPTYTAPPANVPKPVEIPHTVTEPGSDFHRTPAYNPPSSYNPPNPGAITAYVQQRNTQNYATGQQVGAALANGTAAFMSAGRCKKHPDACGMPSRQVVPDREAMARHNCELVGYTWIPPDTCKSNLGDDIKLLP
jgi:hypothetical protein